MSRIWIAAASSIAVAALMFLIFWIPRRGHSYDMDPLEKWGAFEPHMKRYQELARLLLTLATASIAFLANFLVGLDGKQSLRGNYAGRLESAVPWALGFLCTTVISTILFMLTLSYFYEEYVHFNYLPNEPAWEKLRARGRYYAWKSSLVWTLATVALLAFFIAYAVIAIRLTGS